MSAFSKKLGSIRAVSMKELERIQGGQGRGIYTGDQSKLIALQKNGANVSEPQLGGPDAYYPASGQQLNGSDGYGNPYGIYD